MEADDQKPPPPPHLVAVGGAIALGGVLAYFGVFGFAGALFNLGVGAALAVAARVVAALLVRSPRWVDVLFVKVANPLSIVALLYFAIGFAVFWEGYQAPDIGRIDEQELDFFALVQEQEEGRTYSARFKVQPPGAYASARYGFGSIEGAGDTVHITKLDFEPVGELMGSIKRIEPRPEHMVALLFRRVEAAHDVAVILRAEIEGERPPELIYVSVAAEYGQKDLAWHVVRHYRHLY